VWRPHTSGEEIAAAATTASADGFIRQKQLVCESRTKKDGAGFEAKAVWRVKGDQPLGSLWSVPVQKDGYLCGMLSFE
jgi:hypothetical protein